MAICQRKKFSRRTFLRDTLAATAGLSGILASGCAPGLFSRRRPNIVLVTIDTMRYDRLGFNGYERMTTPYLGGLAEKGVVFDSNYSQAPSTLPSISSLLTSKYPRDIGMVYNWSKPALSARWFPELLKNKEYQTFGVVSMPLLNSQKRFDSGFDFFSFPPEVTTRPRKPSKCKRRGDESAKIMADLLKRNAGKSKPVFCWYHTFDPHTPYMAPGDFGLKYRTDGSFDDREDISHLISMVEDDILDRCPRRMFTEKQVFEFSDRYDGEVAFADSNIQQLLEFMVKEKIFDLDRDLFVLTADHGELLGEHTYFASHHGAYEEVIHVPLMMAGAGLPKGKRIDAVTRNLDVIPTIAELVDIKPLESWRGESLVGNIQGAPDRIERPVFVDLTGMEGFALRHENYKLIKRRELPDLKHDGRKEGFYPTGSLSYDAERKSFPIGWTTEWEEGRKDLTVNLRLSAVSPAKNARFNIFERNSAYVRAIDVFCLLYFFGEDKWNASCAKYKKFIWRVKVAREVGGASEVVLDSGELEFMIKPTSRFHELYDMENDLEETTNLFAKDTYKDIQNQLNLKLEKFLGAEAEFERHEPEKSERETLKALGYL